MAAPARGRLAHALRVAAWNATLILGGLAVIAAAGETWLRLNAPFLYPVSPSRFAPGVGVLYEPHAEVRHTNHLDFWTTQRANSLGFLDREPPDPARAAASCHVAFVGDSFVEAREVAIADKLQVRLEALAADALPELDVTASAYGRHSTGQAGQLPFHDEYARRLSPNLLALVFHGNDFADNSPALQAIRLGWDPDRPPFALPARGEDGAIRLRPPHPDYAGDTLPWFREWQEPPLSERWYESLGRRLAERSLFARWLDAKTAGLRADGEEPYSLPSLVERAEAVSRRPGYARILEGWPPTDGPGVVGLVLAERPAPVFAEAIEFTAWSLAEFRRRADRDGTALVVLTTHHVGDAGSRRSVLLRGMTAPLGIPVINLHDWIARSGGRIEDATFRHDVHWNAQGHRWAAEAILDWLRQRPEVCEDAA